MVLEATDGPGALLSYELGADGTTRGLLYADVGGFMLMEGRELFRRAVRAMVESAESCLSHAGVSIDQVALLVPHQANIRIIEAAASRLGISTGRTASVLDRTGNTSAGSIPLALVDAVDADRLSPGDLVLLCGFGAGMTTASALVRWDGPGAPRAGGRDRRTPPVSRVVLVTGGSRGIGLACAQAFAAQGDQVALTYRSAPPDAARAEGLLCVPCDITDAAQVDAAFARSRRHSVPSRCWWPTPGSPTTCSCCAWTTTRSPAWSTPT